MLTSPNGWTSQVTRLVVLQCRVNPLTRTKSHQTPVTAITAVSASAVDSSRVVLDCALRLGAYLDCEPEQTRRTGAPTTTATNASATNASHRLASELLLLAWVNPQQYNESQWQWVLFSSCACVCVVVGGVVLCRCVCVWPVDLFTILLLRLLSSTGASR